MAGVARLVGSQHASMSCEFSLLVAVWFQYISNIIWLRKDHRRPLWLYPVSSFEEFQQAFKEPLSPAKHEALNDLFNGGRNFSVQELSEA